MSSKTLGLLFLALGLLLALRFFQFFTSHQSYEEGRIVKFTTRLSQAPKFGINYQQVSLRLPNNERAFVRLSQEPALTYGDTIEISGVISYVETSSGSKLITLEYPKFNLVQADSSFIGGLRSRIIGFFKDNLGQNDSALMLGIIFGIKQDFSTNFRQNIEKTGLLHVVAASGMNITMLGGLSSALLAFFFSRRLSIVLTISIIAFYAILAGLEPSIVRASIMGILVFTAQILGRQSTSFVALGFAAFFMLIIDPMLILDIGFQLSFMATFGLIFFRPVFYGFSKVREVTEKSVLGEDFLTTITAQIFTLPILVLSFGSYSPASIVSNMLVLWSVPILMIIGGIAVLAGLLIEPVGRVVLFLCLPLLDFFTGVVNWFGQRASVFTFASLPIWFAIGYYMVLFSIIIRFSKAKE